MSTIPPIHRLPIEILLPILEMAWGYEPVSDSQSASDLVLAVDHSSSHEHRQVIRPPIRPLLFNLIHIDSRIRVIADQSSTIWHNIAEAVLPLQMKETGSFVFEAQSYRRV